MVVKGGWVKEGMSMRLSGNDDEEWSALSWLGFEDCFDLPCVAMKWFDFEKWSGVQ